MGTLELRITAVKPGTDGKMVRQLVGVVYPLVENIEFLYLLHVVYIAYIFIDGAKV